LADNVGNLISITNIFNFLKVILKKDISLKTISSYLGYLTSVYLVSEAERYDLSGKKILEYV
jgi:predicted AAA+ superfamily ATPase